MKRKRLATVEEAILVYLIGFSKYREEEDVPLSVSQIGISRSLSIRRSHISTSLDSAKKRGFVEEKKCRVKGEPRKRKSYFLTEIGSTKAIELEKLFLEQEVNAIMRDGEEFQGRISEFLEKIDNSSNLARILTHTYEGTVHLSEISESDESQKMSKEIPNISLLIGREDELTEIDKVVSGKSNIMVVTGIGGIGKTALLAHTLNNSKHTSEVFWFDVGEWSSIRNTSMHLGNFLDGKGSSRLKRYMSAHENPDMADIYDILVNLDVPLILAFDDIHNSSLKFQLFLRMLVSAGLESKNMKLFLLGRSDPGILENKHLHDPRSVRSDLAGLSEGSSIELLKLRGFTEGQAKVIAEKSGGHPLYLSLIKDANPGAIDDIEKILANDIFNQLKDDEKEILARLSVFREPVNSDAIVLDNDDFDILEDLAGRSLVMKNDGWSTHGLLRNFFYDRQLLRTRLSLHEMASEYYNSKRLVSDRIEETYHLIKAHDAETAIFLMRTEGKSWLKQGYQDEIVNLFEMISNTDMLDDVNEIENAFELNMLAGLAHTRMGNWPISKRLLSQALGLASVMDDDIMEARALHQLGVILYRRGDLEEALEQFVDAIELVKEQSKLRSEIDNSMGVIYWRLGKPELARASYEEDLAISRDRNDLEGIVRALNNLGILHCEAEDHDRALELYAEAMKLAERDGDHKLVSILYSNIADSYKSKGNMAEARRFYERCVQLSEDLGFRWQIAEAYRGMAEVIPDERDTYLEKSLAIFQGLGAKEDIISVKKMMDME